MALIGIKFRAYPSAKQKNTFSQWMGCARFIYNAKCEEQEYFYRFKTRYLPINTHAPVDQCYSQFKSKELTPWLYECPSILLRNTAYTWKNTFFSFLKGECGKPKKKKKGQRDSIWLTSELFRFEKNKLFIGSKKYNLGELSFKAHRSFKEPKSIRIKKLMANIMFLFVMIISKLLRAKPKNNILSICQVAAEMNWQKV